MIYRRTTYYIFFFILAVTVFLFVSFPDKRGVAFFEQALSGELIKVTIKDVKLMLPVGLRFDKFVLSVGPALKIRPDSVTCSFSPLALFTGLEAISFESRCLGGMVSVRLSEFSHKPLEQSMDFVTWSNLELKDIRYDTNLSAIQFSCRTAGHYSLSGFARNNSSRGKVSFSDVTAVVDNAVFSSLNFPTIEFSDITLEFTQKKNKLNIVRGIAKGPLLHLNLTGNVVMNLPLEESEVDLAVSVLPSSPYYASFAHLDQLKSKLGAVKKDGFEFTLIGTVKHLEFGI